MSQSVYTLENILSRGIPRFSAVLHGKPLKSDLAVSKSVDDRINPLACPAHGAVFLIKRCITAHIVCIENAVYFHTMRFFYETED